MAQPFFGKKYGLVGTEVAQSNGLCIRGKVSARLVSLGGGVGVDFSLWWWRARFQDFFFFFLCFRQNQLL